MGSNQVVAGYYRVSVARDDMRSPDLVSVPQVYALVRSGELPAIKIGGRGVWQVGPPKAR